VVVRINDRGPFHNNRIIDLSYVAAYKLGLLAKGSGLVDVEAIDARSNANANAQTTLPAEASAKAVASVEPVALPTSAPANALATDDSGSTMSSRVFIQVGAFKFKGNADSLSEKLRAQNLVENSPINSWYNEGMHRVRIGPYASRQDAERNAAKIKEALRMKTYVIVQP
jgi:rare lipoprotein A